MKKITAVAFLLCGMIFFTACGQGTNDESDTNNTNKSSQMLRWAEVIDDKNRDLIGAEVSDPSIPEKVEFTDIRDADQPDKLKGNAAEFEEERKMPENNVVKTLEDETMIYPASISEFETTDGKTPEIIMPNGSAAIFMQRESKGWQCEPGDTLSYEFEKYESDVSDSQSVVIGYILNGTMYEGEVFRELDGTYQVDIAEEGEYYIYVISATSDYVAFQQGTIGVGK